MYLTPVDLWTCLYYYGILPQSVRDTPKSMYSGSGRQGIMIEASEVG